MKHYCKISECETLKKLRRVECNNECMSIRDCMFCEYKKNGFHKLDIEEMKLTVDCDHCLN